MRILIVDDSKNKIKWIEEILREKDIEYEVISYLEEAWKKIDNSKFIDGIILDMEFPISVNHKTKERTGLVLLNKMKNKNIEIPTLGNSTIRFPDSEYPFLKGQLYGYITFDGINTLLKFLESIEERS